MPTLPTPRPDPRSPADPPRPAPGRSAPLWLRLVAFAGAMALVLGLATIPRSALFSVRAITVAGAQAVPAGEVVARSGLRPGARLAAIDPAAVARRLEVHPRIRRAAVRLILPDRVAIEIDERGVLAALRLGGAFLLVDAGAVPVARAAGPGGLPVVEVAGPAPPWVRLGQAMPSAGVVAGIRAVATLPPALRDEVRTVRLDRRREVTLVTRDGIAVRVGGLRGLADRIAVLPQILAAVREQGVAVEYIDARFGDNVVVKPAPPRAPEGDAP